MNSIVLLITMIVMWVIVVASTYQRFYTMPKWFENPPASFERIRRQSKASQAFWLPITALSLIAIVADLILNWHYLNIRICILSALLCFIINGVSTGAYFVKEILYFARMPANVSPTGDLLNRTKFWLKWTTVRNVLQIGSAVFISIAYHYANH